MDKSKRVFIRFIIFFLSFQIFAQINVISPIPGTWSNKQMLIIDCSEGGDYYYSINGADPQSFGFAYDGPVLIDTIGDITLRIIKDNNINSEKVIEYTVDLDNGFSTDYASFISSFYDFGLYNYTIGTEFIIPENLKYSFGLPPDSFISGRSLTINEKSVLSRYIPCTIWDSNTNKKWRFIVKTYPQRAGIFGRRDVPFYVTDWNTITFTDEDLIYKVDSNYWQPMTSIELDRSVSHMISWQSIAYEQGNPIEYFVLPAKPEIHQREMEDGAIIYSLTGDSSYNLSVLSYDDEDYQQLFNEIAIDTFYGDQVKGSVDIGVFSNSVYQGKITSEYEINKRPPSIPTIYTSSENFYSRLPVNLEVEAEEGANLFVSISEPLLIEDLSVVYSSESEIFSQVKNEEFVEINSSYTNFTLQASTEGAVYYKVIAYSQKEDNISLKNEYSVIIDQYNYYFDASSKSEIADGTANNPYTNFDQCIDSVNKSRFAQLRVKGTMMMPQGETVLHSNCSILNDGDAALIFPKDSSLVIKSASLSIDDCIIQTDDKSQSKKSKIIPLIKLENSVLDLKNSHIAVNFGKNGTVIDSYSSTVNLKNNIVSVNSTSYASFVLGVKTRLAIENSSVNINSSTVVALSINDGHIDILNNTFNVYGQKGRIAEIFKSSGTIKNNYLTGDFTTPSNIYPIYIDDINSILEVNNEAYGF